MASFDHVGPGRALVLGAAIAGANPKNLAFTYAAASSIGALGLTGASAVTAGGVYVVLASSSVLAAVVAHLVLGPRAESALSSAKQFMLTNNTVIMMVILLLLGAKLIGDGLAGVGDRL